VVGVAIFRGGYILDFVYPPAALALVTVVGLAYRAVAERASRQELEELFGRYVSPPVAEELVERADRGDLRLGGELREVTVMFADIRGFTPMAERMEAEELVDLLNRCFDVMVSEIMKHRGIVNKFAGDAVMAIWNAPKEEPDHVLLACSAAIAAQRELDSLGPGEPVARFGFGIHSGVALAGNVGAVGRLEYTVIGNSVNLAARLAQAAGPGQIWVSEQTFQRVQDHLKAEQMPPQHLKGIETPVSAYSLTWEVPEPAVQAEV
jgi:adenylate cyclase